MNRTEFIQILKTKLITIYPELLDKNPRLKSKADKHNLSQSYFESKDPSYLITLFVSYELDKKIYELLDDPESKIIFNKFMNNLAKIS